MNELAVFNFESNVVRVTDRDGNPWFVLRDLLKAMGTTTPTGVALETIKDGLGKGYNNVIPLETPGGIQKINIINESAATFLLSRSNTEQGKKLNRFIHVEVLPSIRKTGSYAISKNQDSILMIAEAITLIRKNQIEIDNRLQILERQNETKADLIKLLPNVKDKTERQMLNEVIRSYAGKNNWEISDVWNKLRREFYYRYSINLKVKAKNRNMKPLDYAEKHGHMEDLLALALELFA